RERPYLVCGLLRTFPPRARRTSGAPVWAASCRRSRSEQPERTATAPQRRAFVEVAQGRADSRIPAPFAVPSIAAGAGSARRVAARDCRDREAAQGLCRLSDPAPARSAGTPRRALMRGGAPRLVPSLFGYFFCNEKK